jgi:hypothetical protein
MILSKDSTSVMHKQKLLNLYRSDEHKYSSDCIAELYADISSNGKYKTRIHTITFLGLKTLILGIFRRLPASLQIRLPFCTRKVINFTAQLGPDFKLCIPAYLTARNNYIYMFDAWPRFHRSMAVFLDLFNVKAVFFSSREVNRLYQLNTQSACKSYWIPEGIRSEEYQFTTAKSIDVLEFGRKYQRYHDLIVGRLADNNKKHVYLKENESILYESKKDFVYALGDSKISICIPSNITHPERSEEISTMTLRYLQCMASKCLIVGILPDEMEEVFGYIPMIQIDFDRPEQQLLDILNNYSDYAQLIEKNYQEVLMHHQWSHRWITMDGIINELSEA